MNLNSQKQMGLNQIRRQSSSTTRERPSIVVISSPDINVEEQPFSSDASYTLERPRSPSRRTSVSRAPSISLFVSDKAEEEVEEFTGIKLLNRYVILETIGEGACGKVKLAFSLEKNTSVAIKAVAKRHGVRSLGTHRSSVCALDAREELLRHEIAVMKKLRHRNIVALYEVIDDPDAEKLYLVMQYIDRGSIRSMSVAATCDVVEPNALSHVVSQIAAALKYLHRHGVVHHDVKPENILVDSSGHAYLSDFGVAEASSHEEDALHYGGTPLFMAPELHADDASCRLWSEAQRCALDIWALGVTIYALLVGRLPFSSVEDILDEQFVISFPPEHATADHDSSLPEEWRRFVLSLLHRDPLKRPEADAVRREAESLESVNAFGHPKSHLLAPLNRRQHRVSLTQQDLMDAVV
jgi:serine/threonine protein kinase